MGEQWKRRISEGELMEMEGLVKGINSNGRFNLWKMNGVVALL